MLRIPLQTKIFRPALLAVAMTMALAACGGGQQNGGQGGGAAQGGAQGAGGGQQQAPAPVVGVVTVQPSTATLSAELPARLQSRRTADVRAQVGGIVQKRLFQEGAYVRAGQALYQIDASTYEASLQSAQASLASAEASLAKANADVARYKPLVAADAMSKQDFDAAIQAQRAAVASVDSARAAIRSAKISVGRSRITAPISGFIGQSKVSEGTLLASGDTTVLATIQQTDPMYVNITQSAATIMKLKQQMAAGQVQSVSGGMPVTILLEDGSEYAHQGRLVFADPTVDETTGQVTIRAEVPNPDNVLMPNLYVRVRLPQANLANAFVVPQQAVSRGQKDTVMIVNAQGGMEPRVVTISGQQGSSWVITGGLQAGDKVIVDGTMIAGMMQAKKVTPKEWTPPAHNQAAPAAASAPKAAVQTASAPAQQAASSAKKP